MKNKWIYEYSLESCKNTLKWLEWAAEERTRPKGAPAPVVGRISEMIILGNQLNVDIELTPEIMKQILEHNMQRLHNQISELKRILDEREK